MLRRIRTVITALVFAVLGALVGRAVADLRGSAEVGEEPRRDAGQLNVARLAAAVGTRLPLDNLPLGDLDLRPRDIVPGVVAGMRMDDRPWSYLHVPPWFAAFGVSFAMTVFPREIAQLTGADQGDDDQPPAPVAPAVLPPQAGRPPKWVSFPPTVFRPLSRATGPTHTPCPAITSASGR